MSKIWDSLVNVEGRRNKHGSKIAASSDCGLNPDRRSTRRLWAYVPVLVYGYAGADSPFHEATEAMHVNARGGLITLIAVVEPGQSLLLMNKANLKEQKCSVVRQTSSYLNRSAVVVEFPQAVSDFWGA